MFANPSDVARRTARSGFASGTPVDALTRAQVDWRVTSDLHTFLGQDAHRARLFDQSIEQVEQITGKRLRNPYAATDHKVGINQRMAEEQFFSELAELRERHPELAASAFGSGRVIGRMPQSIEEMDERLRQNREILRSWQEEIHNRTTSPWVDAAGMAASMAAAATDPPVLMSMLIGAPWSAGVLRFALTEAGIAAATEVGVQAGVQWNRTNIGEQADLSEALQAIAFAAGGGALFGGLLRGLPPTIRATRQLVSSAERLPAPTAEVRAATAYLDRLTDVQERNPLAPTGRAFEEHMARTDAQMAAVREQRVAELGRAEAPVSRAVIRELNTPVSQTVVATVGEPVATAATTIRQVAAQMAGRDQSRRAVADALTPIADNPEAVAALFKALRDKPLGVEGLLLWLSRNGGVKAQDVASTGIKPRTFPGVVRRQGRAAEEAAQAAREAGFPVNNADELLDAIQQEMRGQRVVRPEQAGRLLEMEALDVIREGLDTFGINARQIATPEDFQTAIAGMAQRAARDTDAPVSRAIEMGEERALPEMLAEEKAELVRLYAGRENEVVRITDENGHVRAMTVREMLQGIERDADALEVLRICGG